MLKDILMFYMVDSGKPWVIYEFDAHKQIDVTKPALCRSENMMECVEVMRNHVKTNGWRLNKQILRVGNMPENRFPDFFTPERVIYPGMIEVQNFWDDSELAILRLSI